ncbi:hypothetical protein [uncultured Roseobacter sp.]|uniref:hypothetical protein n=1 Tax=uncultured Roseobacter sp. TaxID=114847 RepID=UPI002613F7B5|nr:hypothetical protein [uncultured Roseobacter sp.]
MHEDARTETATATKTVNVYHCHADNIGDRLCGPAQYFWPDKVATADFAKTLAAPENLILGGGQVFGQLSAYAEHYKDSLAGALIAWGVGVPDKGKQTAQVLDVASRFALFGTRHYGWRDTLTFVPCASCMSAAFDTVPEPTHEVVLYAHRRKTPEFTAEEGVPFITNRNQSAQSVIDFIASGETVVTSSYHGVYWAQLLGRKVLCIPYNRKFSTLQHPAVTTTETSWRSMLSLAKRTEPLLDAYREINRRFAVQVAERLELDD